MAERPTAVPRAAVRIALIHALPALPAAAVRIIIAALRKARLRLCSVPDLREMMWAMGERLISVWVR